MMKVILCLALAFIALSSIAEANKIKPPVSPKEAHGKPGQHDIKKNGPEGVPKVKDENLEDKEDDKDDKEDKEFGKGIGGTGKEVRVVSTAVKVGVGKDDKVIGKGVKEQVGGNLPIRPGLHGLPGVPNKLGQPIRPGLPIHPVHLGQPIITGKPGKPLQFHPILKEGPVKKGHSSRL